MESKAFLKSTKQQNNFPRGVQASSEFQKPRAPGHEFGIKNNFFPYGDTSEKAVPVEFVPIFFVSQGQETNWEEEKVKGMS